MEKIQSSNFRLPSPVLDVWIMLSSALWISLNIGLSTGSHCQPATCTTEHHTNTTTAFISLFFRHTQTAYAKLTSYNLRIKSAKQVLDWHHGFGLSSKLASLLQMITVFHLLITASYHRWVNSSSMTAQSCCLALAIHPRNKSQTGCFLHHSDPGSAFQDAHELMKWRFSKQYHFNNNTD